MSKPEDASESDGDEPAQSEHLDGISSSCGCVEVWEELSEHRQQTD
jgi:hypothetical protein